MRNLALIALLQFGFATTWTVYVVFLPQLAAQAGIPKSFVIFILLIDQLIFTATDAALGVASDKIASLFGRLANWMTVLSLASIAAFVALPHLAPVSGGAWMMVALLVWAITSAALRAPPMLLLAKYLPASNFPRAANVAMVGIGLAGAVAPALTVQLRGLNPVLPFALAGVGLAVTVLGLRWCERSLAADAPPPPNVAPKPLPIGLLGAVAVLLAGLAFQLHTSINSAPLYTKFAAPGQLPWLMGVFWIGFTLGLIPATMLTSAKGGARTAIIGAVAAILLLVALPIAPNLAAVVSGQLLAGGAWALIFGAVLALAREYGHTGREGRNLGFTFALLALAAFVRIGIIAAEWHKTDGAGAWLTWAPPVAFGAATLIVLWMTSRSTHRSPQTRIN